MSNDTFDVLVIGAGPAGCAAAMFLAKNERRVALIDAAKFPRKATSAGWLNSRAAAMLDELGVLSKPLLTQVFDKVTFHSADFEKTAIPHFENAPGYLIDRAAFDNALVKAAKSLGVKLIDGTPVTELRLNETTVQATLADNRTIDGRLLVFSAGLGSPLLDRIGFSQYVHQAPMWTAQIDVPLPKGSPSNELRVGVILGLDRGASFSLYCVGPQRMSININWTGDSELAPAAFAATAKAAFSHGIVPVDVSLETADAKFVPCPAAAALDMDTHVGKHCLLIGDAGGFVAAASNEGLYPAMWSGQIAAEVIESGLNSQHSQDALMGFNTAWRMQMADYLRAPHTDVQFLLPLIFSNQPMADRMAAAFFSGENI